MSEFNCQVIHQGCPEEISCADKTEYSRKNIECSEEYLQKTSLVEGWCVSCQANEKIKALKESRDELLNMAKYLYEGSGRVNYKPMSKIILEAEQLKEKEK